jgi:hypothetical protein
MTIFHPSEQRKFEANYPEVAHKLDHGLASHPLLELEALADLARGLAPEFIECNLGNQPIGVDRVPEQLREQVVDTILNIGKAGCWVGLRNVEQAPEYAELLATLLEEMRPQIERKTGPMMNLQSFIFVTSRGSDPLSLRSRAQHPASASRIQGDDHLPARRPSLRPG